MSIPDHQAVCETVYKYAYGIDGVTLTVLWRRGDESIMAEAARRGLARPN